MAGVQHRFVAGSCARALAVALVVSAAGCIYLDDFNQRPSASIENLHPEEPIHAGDTVELSAIKSSDPDDDFPLRATWSVVSCATLQPDTDCFEAAPPITGGIGNTFTVPITDKRPRRVSLTIVDPDGAVSAPVQMELVPTDQDPTIDDVQVQGHDAAGGGFTIGPPITVLVAGSDPDDPAENLTWTFTLFPPPESNPDAVSFETVDATTRILRPDVPGLWRVQITLDDMDGGVVMVDEPILVVPDVPPCIQSTDPAAPPDAVYVLDRTGLPRRFAVLTVRDDLDPHPPTGEQDTGAAAFRWWVASPATGGELVEAPGHTSEDYVVDPAIWAPGDRLELRVEVDDRVPRSLPCADDEPTCSLSGDTCLQRVTWSVEVR